jgi:hypothetical protein
MFWLFWQLVGVLIGLIAVLVILWALALVLSGTSRKMSEVRRSAVTCDPIDVHASRSFCAAFESVAF